MRQLLFTCAVLGGCLVSAQPSRFVIQGRTHPEQYPVTHVVVAYPFSKPMVSPDTIRVIDGRFEIRGQLKEPTRLSLTMVPDTLSPLVKVKRAYAESFPIDAGEMHLDYIQPGRFSVTGSALYDDYALFRALVLQRTSGMNGVNSVRTRREMADSFIRVRPASPYSLLLLEELSRVDFEAGSLPALYEMLPPEHRSGATGRLIEQRLATLVAVRPGMTAPEFVLPDGVGNPHRLSDFRGRYVLLDFWASWCHSCRLENPHLLSAYASLRGVPVDFVSISLDDAARRKEWLKAVKMDRLPWLQLVDSGAFDGPVAKVYGIRAIPRNFLVAPDGKIVAMDLRGEDVAKKIRSYLDP